MDLVAILTSLATAITMIGFVYGFLRNFKIDINSHIDRLETRMDKFEIKMYKMEERLDSRMNKLEQRLDSRVNKLEERMFWLATGKKLEDAILEEQIKRQKSA
ncbi:MAG: hypothetical protein ACRDDW_07430 [Candidatus Rhabdochlamydia sp.]